MSMPGADSLCVPEKLVSRIPENPVLCGSVAASLATHLRKTAAKNPDKRWQSIVQSTIGYRRRPVLLGFASLFVLLTVVVAALVLSRSGEKGDQSRVSFEVPTPATPTPLVLALSPSRRYAAPPIWNG